ncbi:MAG: PRC-barrel domain containing protein [Desulfobacteraceae bacterium]|nr:MAG: PRC-barrel domain containing protein [Desulfobacteraceae bacterium]
MNKKTLITMATAAILSFGVSGAFADMDRSKKADQSVTSEFKAHKGDVTAWIGKDVKNRQGEDLGDISQFIIDENGQHSLVIISQGGVMGVGDKKVAVPFSALSFNEGEDHAVMDVTKDQLANAPQVDENANLNDSAFSDQVHSYWNDAEGAASRGYYEGSDEGITEDFDADMDRNLDTNEYFGTDKGFDADKDLDNGGAGLNSGMDS